jgi:predicted DCC family thiol-disulfide oxidoreductase YuxK
VEALADAAISEAGRSTNVVFFDGVCGLCNRFVDFVLSRDRQKTIRFAPLQGETANRLKLTQLFAKPSSTKTPAFKTVVWLDEHEEMFVRSAAVVRVLWQIGGVWSLCGTLLWLVPRPLRDIAYRAVSANRYWLFGQKETCRLPNANERQRFLP